MRTAEYQRIAAGSQQRLHILLQQRAHLRALQIAALANQREAIEFLTEHGADPHAKNPLGQDAFDMTPLLALHALMNRKKARACGVKERKGRS